MLQFLIDEGWLVPSWRQWIELSAKYERIEVFLFLTRDESPFEHLDLLEEVDQFLLARTNAPIRSAAQLSGLSKTSIICTLYMQTDYNFNKYHFEMLLREVVTAQADLGYYISWLTRIMKQQRVNGDVSRLFLSCIDSISTRRVVHTSDYFTAYSAFFLLANLPPGGNVQAVLRTIESEVGVTAGGLLKARLLLGAFDARDTSGN
ncbi:Hypothetical protein POVR2_LOCUS330 [uncultured virus]|nr:Hypothetical protein POVR2_LOCUS330 [uncultured virus]